MSEFILSAFADEIDMDLQIQMDVLADHDIEYIEMRGVNGKCVVDYSLEEVREIKEQLDKRGFKISAVGSPLGKIDITDDFKPHYRLFQHTLDVAEILETNYIRMFSFYIPEGEHEKYRDEVMRRWSQFVEKVEGTDVVLLHENEKEIYGDTPEHCLDLLETMDSENMKAIYDPANFIQWDVETYPKAFNMLKDYIEYLHIKDALYSDHSVVPAGQGDGKIKEVLKELDETGFEGFLSLEPHLGSFEGLSELEKDTKYENLEEGGPKKFALAVDSLKSVIKEI